MKFKKLIKDNIKRISAVILCMILIFTCTITAFAYDGEAPSKIITADDLKEYNDKAFVYFNTNDTTYGISPIYSPFNLKTMDAVMSISASASDGSTTYLLDPDIYFAVSTYAIGSGSFQTTYIIPSVPSSTDIWHFLQNQINDGFVFNDWLSVFYRILAYCFENSKYVSVNDYGYIQNLDFSKANNYFSSMGILSDNFEEKGLLSALVYTVDFRKDGLIKNITYGGYYQNIGEAFTSLGSKSGISQIYMYDANKDCGEDYSSTRTPLLNAPILYEDVINLNQYISSSTYSLTAIDYFAYEEVSDSGSYVTLKSQYYNLKSGLSQGTQIAVPSHFLKEEYRSSSEYTQLPASSSDGKYFSNMDIYEENKSWIFIPLTTSGSKFYDGYFIEFEDGTNPIIYFKIIMHKKDTAGNVEIYLQLISKVDYTLYCAENWNYIHCGILGTFDASTSSYTGTDLGFNDYWRQAVDYYNSCTPIQSTTVSKYPSIIIGTGNTSNPSDISRLPGLGDFIIGRNCVASCYSTETQGVGFYYYISSENMPNIIGNSSSSGGSIPGDGGGNYQPPFDSDLDWEKFWEFTIDYDSMKSDAFKGYELTPYPDLPFKSLDGINLFTIPDDLLDYMVSCIQWYGDNLNSFIDYVGGPIGKMLTMMRMIFENCPDVLKFLFMLFFFFFAAMKIMQFDTGYLLAQTSSDINSQILAQNREIQKRNESIIREQNRVAAIQAREEAQRHKAAVAETKRRQTWRGWKSSTSSEASLKEKFESKFGSKDGGS